MSGMDVLRERIAWALWENRYPTYGRMEGPLWNLYLTDADAVIAALRLTEDAFRAHARRFNIPVYRRWVTAEELVEEDA